VLPKEAWETLKPKVPTAVGKDPRSSPRFYHDQDFTTTIPKKATVVETFFIR